MAASWGHQVASGPQVGLRHSLGKGAPLWRGFHTATDVNLSPPENDIQMQSFPLFIHQTYQEMTVFVIYNMVLLNDEVFNCGCTGSGVFMLWRVFVCAGIDRCV